MMKQRNLKDLCDEAFGVSRKAGSVKRKSSVIPAKAGIQELANYLLAGLRLKVAELESMLQTADAEMKVIAEAHSAKIEPLQIMIKAAEAELITLMKQNKPILFDGTDVVNLPHGSLIHNIADKVTIPKTALAECKELGFQDVIKIVESLDRDKIEKWPDAKLVLIGAERKQKEEFSYDLKK